MYALMSARSTKARSMASAGWVGAQGRLDPMSIRWQHKSELAPRPLYVQAAPACGPQDSSPRAALAAFHPSVQRQPCLHHPPQPVMLLVVRIITLGCALSWSSCVSRAFTARIASAGSDPVTAAFRAAVRLSTYTRCGAAAPAWAVHPAHTPQMGRLVVHVHHPTSLHPCSHM